MSDDSDLLDHPWARLFRRALAVEREQMTAELEARGELNDYIRRKVAEAIEYMAELQEGGMPAAAAAECAVADLLPQERQLATDWETEDGQEDAIAGLDDFLAGR